MHRVEPEVHLVASTVVDSDGLNAYLESIGALQWTSDAPSEVEEVVEVMSRSCYKSFAVGLNPNVSRIREGNRPHLENILASGHGSVLEHAWASWMLCGVSRVLTHELVRHRVGVAISQESLRYVRLTDLGVWVPSCFRDNPKAVAIFERAFRLAEENYAELLSPEILGTDMDNLGFKSKKELTSAARRVAPIGLATNIGWSCNMRALRHVIEMRTDPAAEEEIRLVFGKVAEIARQRWPNLFGDYRVEEVDGLPHYKTERSKV